MRVQLLRRVEELGRRGAVVEVSAEKAAELIAVNHARALPERIETASSAPPIETAAKADGKPLAGQ